MFAFKHLSPISHKEGFTHTSSDLVAVPVHVCSFITLFLREGIFFAH